MQPHSQWSQRRSRWRKAIAIAAGVVNKNGVIIPIDTVLVDAEALSAGTGS